MFPFEIWNQALEGGGEENDPNSTKSGNGASLGTWERDVKQALPQAMVGCRGIKAIKRHYFMIKIKKTWLKVGLSVDEERAQSPLFSWATTWGLAHSYWPNEHEGG